MKIVGIAVSMLLIVWFPANAALVVIGTPGGLPGSADANFIPFGDATVIRYQQIYNSNQFTSPVMIRDIQFYMTQYLGGDLRDTGLTITLSQTHVGVTQLTEQNLDSNVGADATLFYSGGVNGGAATNTLSFAGTPFVYNPNDGNLLLDFRFSSTTSPINNPAAYDAFFTTTVSPAAIFARACSPACNDLSTAGSAVQIGGLVTGFDLTPIPLPSTFLFFSSGLVSLIGLSKRCGSECIVRRSAATRPPRRSEDGPFAG